MYKSNNESISPKMFKYVPTFIKENNVETFEEFEVKIESILFILFISLIFIGYRSKKEWPGLNVLVEETKSALGANSRYECTTKKWDYTNAKGYYIF